MTVFPFASSSIWLALSSHLSSAGASLPISPSKAFFMLGTEFLISSTSFWVFLRISVSAYVAHLFSHAVYFIH